MVVAPQPTGVGAGEVFRALLEAELVGHAVALRQAPAERLGDQGALRVRPEGGQPGDVFFAPALAGAVVPAHARLAGFFFTRLPRAASARLA